MIAGHAIKTVNDNFLAANQSLVLWLVPSDAIREQTLYVLKTPGEILHQAMRDLFGAVNVLGIKEALSLQPSTLNTANTIIVSTMQSFKRDDPTGLKVYEQSGSLMSHFEGVSAELRGNGSLVDAIKLRRPFVIVDEAHNAGTPLAVDTLLKLNPSCILELTATPDRAVNPSNVLRSISASVLQNEDMIKLPLELAISPEYKVALSEAINRVRSLETEAVEEQKLTGERIDPVVMLIQGESAQAGHERFTPPVVKEILVNDFKIPAEKIAIEYLGTKELEGKRLGDPDFPQFVITVDKLREGWDCPFAYVLFSFRSTTSTTAVEQILGRILRMPHVTRKQREGLNRSYAYVVSDQLAETVNNLRDGLVQSGFERLAAKDMIYTPDVADENLALFPMQQDLTIPLPEANDRVVLPDNDAIQTLPKALRDRIEISPESGTLTVKDGVDANEIKKIAATFTSPEASKVVRERMDTALTATAVSEKTPAENGEKAKVPLLSYRQFEQFELFDETPLLDADWEITDFDAKLSDKDFGKDVEAMRRASLNISQLEKIQCDVYDRLDSQLALFDAEKGWSNTELVHWLDRNIPFLHADRDQKVAWINESINYLVEKRDLSVEELAYRKFRLRGAIERKLMDGLVQAKQRVFDGLFGDESRFDVRDEFNIAFEQGRYAYDFPYSGVFKLKRHFFPVIGNLKSTGEEFECAQEIANHLPNVQWWVRNVERKRGSFWLQTASDKFYPDFIVRLYDGVTVAVEYKGAHIAEGRESREKKQIGELWAKRSGGRCRFAWVEDGNWESLYEMGRAGVVDC
ncbi:MAG: DEAD/DEAH box helicase family protein [Pyrinomonadaceae bacterium]|nr:DEAD/DEAH box helicase family protein [Pyrinomonadaceae bacterium]